MRIGYISQYFPPESCAPAARVHELAREWVKLGHPTTVITGFPNHPEGKVHAEYRASWKRMFSRETKDNISVFRTWLYPARNQGLWFRSANYVSFSLSSALVGTSVSGGLDVIVATSPQLLVGGSGLFISSSRALPFVFEVRDLWPESLVAVGQTKPDSFLYSMLERFSHLLYRRADHIVVDGKQKRAVLIDLGIPKEKIGIIRSGVADEFCLDPHSEVTHQIRNEVRSQHGWTDRLVVIYFGTIGMAHGLETILETADRLRNIQEIVFVILGEGADKKNLIRRMNEMRLPNVVYFGKQPRERVPFYLAASDVCLVPLKKSPVFRTAIPSKMFEAMGSGKPVILAVEGEAAEILRESSAGIAVQPESAEQMAEAVMRLWRRPGLRHELGSNGRRVVLNEFLRSRLAACYLSILDDVIRRRSHSEDYKPSDSKVEPPLS